MVPLQDLATLMFSSLSYQWCPTWYDGFLLGWNVFAFQLLQPWLPPTGFLAGWLWFPAAFYSSSSSSGPFTILVAYPARFPWPLRACPNHTLFYPAVTFPNRVLFWLIAISCRIIFFLLLLNIFHHSCRIPGHVPRLLWACPCCCLFCARCIKCVLFPTCFLEFVVHSVEFLVALRQQYRALRRFFAVVLPTLLIDHFFPCSSSLDFTFYLKQPFPAANTCLLACLDQWNGWFAADFFHP